MAAVLYPFYTIASLLLAFWGIALFRQSWELDKILLIAVLCGIIYDNLTISAGRFLGEGELLRSLNAVRFLLHHLLSPLLLLVACGLEYQTRAANITAPVLNCAIWAIALGAIAFGIATEFVTLQLAPEIYAGTLRYKKADSKSRFPIIEISTVVLVALVGISLWETIKWPWLLVGALVMLLGGAVPMRRVGPAIGSGCELVLILSLLATECAIATGQILYSTVLP